MQKNPKLKRKGPKPSLKAMRCFYLDIDDIERLVSYSNQLGLGRVGLSGRPSEKSWMRWRRPEKSPPSKKGMMWGLVYEKTNPYNPYHHHKVR